MSKDLHEQIRGVWMRTTAVAGTVATATAAMIWYDSFEDNVEDVIAEIDDYHRKYGD